MHYLLIIFLAVCLMFRGFFGFFDDIKLFATKTWNRRKSVQKKKRALEFSTIRSSLAELKKWGEELDDLYARKS